MWVNSRLGFLGSTGSALPVQKRVTSSIEFQHKESLQADQFTRRPEIKFQGIRNPFAHQEPAYILDALKLGDLEKAKALILKKVDVNARSEGDTALTYAAYKGATSKGYDEITRLLIQNGADVNLQDGEGATALMYTVSAGNETLTRYLVEEAHANVNIVDRQKWSPLMLALIEEQEKLALYLIAKNAYINEHSLTGETPLMIAAQSNQIEALNLLLDYLANPHAQDNHGNTALMLAIKQGQIRSMEAILQRQSSIEDVNKAGVNALLLAAAYPEPAVLETLLAHGNPNLKAFDRQYQNAAVHAAKKGNTHNLLRLVQAGCDPLFPDEEGYNALHWAIRSNHESTAVALWKELTPLKRAQAMILKTRDDETPLLWATIQKHCQLVQVMLEDQSITAETKQQWVNQPDVLGRTPLMWAAIVGDTETATHLIQAGASPVLQDKRGRNALVYASMNHQAETGRFLQTRMSADEIADSEKVALSYLALKSKS
ncbi:MAG: ankyrin repeat domain-containing protein [Cyanobacteria bacterium]|nr:ankyrin repeat domain-containing protein [Cyanobacteriota bacterium]